MHPPPQKASIRIFFDIGFNVSPGTPRCNCWQRSNNTFRRFVTTLVRSARQKRIPIASSSRAGLRTSSTGAVQISRTPQRPRDFAARLRPGYWVVVGPGSGSKWECDKWFFEDPRKEFKSRVQSLTVAPTRIAKCAELVTGTATGNGTLSYRRRKRGG